MIDRSRACVTLASAATVLCALVLPQQGGAQVPEPQVTLSTDSVALAEAFDLNVEVVVPEGSVVFFPDTIPATAFLESREPVEWRARRGPDGGATLELTYSVIPFGTGLVPIPRIDIVTVPREESHQGEGIAGGSLVGSWLDVPRSLRYARTLPEREIWVEHVYTSEDVEAGLSPRPPSDVIGFSWSWPSIALVLFFATVVGSAVVTTTRGWLAGRGLEEPPPPAAPLSIGEARRLALRELDELIEAGPYAPDQAFGVYERSSGVVRGYAGRLDRRWGPEMTSTELVSALEGRSLAGPGLGGEMDRAEAVKFGRLRPDSADTRTHLDALRAWLASASEATE